MSSESKATEQPLDVSMGEGEFKGEFTSCSFKRTGSNEDQEQWLIRDTKYIPGNSGRLSGSDVSKLTSELMKKGNIHQVVLFSGNNGEPYQALVVTNNSKRG